MEETALAQNTPGYRRIPFPSDSIKNSRHSLVIGIEPRF
uniref:Uncharacterized protein n=1 Tax=Arundo donax TaxID=35708 RepID=A0A0A8ZLR8_ARUDO